LFEVPDVLQFLTLQVPPGLLDLGIPFGVGDALGITAQGIEAPAQLMHQVLIMETYSADLLHFLSWLFNYSYHSDLPFPVVALAKTD